MAAVLAVTASLVFGNRSPDSPDIDSYEAIGDSITFGEKLSFRIDKQGYPRRATTSFQGWPAVLGQMLAEKTGATTEVINRGQLGDRVGKIRVQRFSDLFNAENKFRRVLLLIGTNDSNEFNPTQSGLGCAGFACEGTYNGKVRSVIQRLRTAGHQTIYLAMLPPVWGSNLDTQYLDPLDLPAAPRNARIIEYNLVITEELLLLPGVLPGPDLFACFLTPTVNRFSLFEDSLHPNKLGYAFVAALWRDVLTGQPVAPPLESCPSPIYILESLDVGAHGHKQNLLEEGDEYYVDEAHVLASIPDELANGIWVVQENADKDNSDEVFLAFDAGGVPVSVYIAYDPAGSPPTSNSHDFMPVTLSSELLTSDPAAPTLDLVKASDATGTVRIGGNLSHGAAASQQAYVVIVVPKI